MIEFRPQLFAVLRAGYGTAALRADLIAGLTVAIVALPLSMAIAIASGVRPEAGLTTAITGGIIVSLLGGSRYQIAGPAGAFIILVAATVARHGPEGLALATMLSGVFLGIVGVLRAGRFIRYVPYPVTIGFTAGIGLIILASQLHPFLGLELPGPEPGPLVEKLQALWQARATLNGAALALAAGVVALIWALQRFAPKLPALLLAVLIASLVSAGLGLEVATIASEFGGLPSGLPPPRLPDLQLLTAVLPDAIAFTILGAIESLLSATVADGMSGDRHDPDTELIAQGAANVASGLFGGIPVTGTIARTATNVRAGAVSPVSGIAHSVILFLFILIFGRWVAYIPLAALAGVLVWVSLHMIGVRQIVGFIRTSRAESIVLLTTLGLTLFRDLTEGIVVGVALSALIIARRLSHSTVVQAHPGGETDASDPDTITIHVSGAFFFGSAPMIETVLEQIGAAPRRVIFDLGEVTFIDASAAQLIVQTIGRVRKQGRVAEISNARADVAEALRAAGYSA